MANKFATYGQYKSGLQTGCKIGIEREIYPNCEELQEQIEAFLTSSMSEDKRQAIEQQLKEEESNIYNDLIAKVDEWKEIAKQLSIIRLAKEYETRCKKIEEKESTGNEWIETKDWRNTYFKISNNTYRLTISVYEDSRYVNGIDVPTSWEVSYWLDYNADKSGYVNRLARVDKKKFTDKEKAYKYVEGRKNAFSEYFTELYPSIPRKDAHLFSCNGRLLQGYRLEQEQQQ